MTDETYIDPLGRKYLVFKGSEFNELFGVTAGVIPDDDKTVLVPYSEPDDKREFPSNPRFDDYFFAAASGKVFHNVERERAYGPHRPPKVIETTGGLRIEGEKGFVATDLDILREDDWYGECWAVMDAHGWHGPRGGLSQHIIDHACREIGSCAVTRAKLEFGENWQTRVAELATLRLVQPLSRLWYAVNMMALYYCHHDDLRLGYLWAEYRMRMRIEKDAMRGEVVVRSAKSGGIARAESKKASSLSIVAAMKKRVVAGQSIANAARQTYRDGLGSSPEANRKLWGRLNRK